MTLVPILIFWVLFVIGAVAPLPVLLCLFFGSLSFGTLAVVPPEWTRGLTLTATPFLSLLLIFRATLQSPGWFGWNLVQRLPRNQWLLLAFWAVAILATVTLPFVFAGQVEIIPMRGQQHWKPVPLQPSMQNFSQLAYLSVSIVLVLAFTKLLRAETTRRNLALALCFGGIAAILTGCLDLASLYVDLDFLLKPLRTATYALAVDVRMLGGKRVVGLMPEASAYGSVCLGLLSAIYFYRHLFTNFWSRELVAPLIVAGLAVFCFLSKSSGTLVGLGIFVGLVVVDWLWRALVLKPEHVRRKGLRIEAAAFLAILVVAVGYVLVNPEITKPIWALVDKMVLQKSGSLSFEQRGMWRETAWNALWKTHGLGIGVGSARASSSFVTVVSNTGILGGILYYGYLLSCYLTRAKHLGPQEQVVVAGFRRAILPELVIATLVVCTVDFGPIMALHFGLIGSVASSVWFSSAGGACLEPANGSTDVVVPVGEPEDR